MVIGHYVPAFAAQRVEKRIPLWLLFLAPQLIDVVWSLLIIVGIEKNRVVPGEKGENVLDNYYIPFTHSLPGAVALSCLAFTAYRMFRKSRREALVFSLVVFSHWFFDLVSHRPDLPLWGNAHKVGFGLSNFPKADCVVQTALFLIGMGLYVKSTKPISKIGKYGVHVLTVLMVLLQIVLSLPLKPSSPRRIGTAMLMVYSCSTAMIFWIEKNRKVSIPL